MIPKSYMSIIGSGIARNQDSILAGNSTHMTEPREINILRLDRENIQPSVHHNISVTQVAAASGKKTPTKFIQRNRTPK